MTAPRQPLTRRRLTEALAKYGVTATCEMLDDLIAATKRASTAPECIQILQAYGSRPQGIFWEEIEDEVTDMQLWRTIVSSWVGKGFNPMNTDGMRDAYKAGALEDRRRVVGDRLTAQPKGANSIMAMMEREGLLNGNP